MTSSDWVTVAQATELLGFEEPSTVYRYLRKPEADTGIRRMKVGRTTFVHRESLVDYEATVKPGRPPRQK